jgi:multimeric flavodoxin WrbA
MQKIYDELEQADALVLGSPIYMGQMSAQTKTFFDRLFAQYRPRFSPQFVKRTPKKLVLVFSQGNPNINLFQIYYDYTKASFKILDFDVKDTLVVNDTRSQPASEQVNLNNSIQNIVLQLIK